MGCWIPDLEHRVAITFLFFVPKVVTHAEHVMSNGVVVLKADRVAICKSYEPLGKTAKSPRSVLIAGCPS